VIFTIPCSILRMCNCLKWNERLTKTKKFSDDLILKSLKNLFFISTDILSMHACNNVMTEKRMRNVVRRVRGKKGVLGWCISRCCWGWHRPCTIVLCRVHKRERKTLEKFNCTSDLHEQLLRVNYRYLFLNLKFNFRNFHHTPTHISCSISKISLSSSSFV